MRDDDIKAAIAEAEKFLPRARMVRRLNADKNGSSASPKETGALRRSSLELTRALAEMRKP